MTAPLGAAPVGDATWRAARRARRAREWLLQGAVVLALAGLTLLVARRVVDQQLADVEAGGVGEEREPRLDAARVEVGTDVVADDERDRDERDRERTLDEPVAQPSGAARRAPRRIADRRGVPSRHVRARCASGSAARTSGRPWSRGC